MQSTFEDFKYGPMLFKSSISLPAVPKSADAAKLQLKFATDSWGTVEPRLLQVSVPDAGFYEEVVKTFEDTPDE